MAVTTTNLIPPLSLLTRFSYYAEKAVRLGKLKSGTVLPFLLRLAGNNACVFLPFGFMECVCVGRILKYDTDKAEFPVLSCADPCTAELHSSQLTATASTYSTLAQIKTGKKKAISIQRYMTFLSYNLTNSDGPWLSGFSGDSSLDIGSQIPAPIPITSTFYPQQLEK